MRPVWFLSRDFSAYRVADSYIYPGGLAVRYDYNPYCEEVRPIIAYMNMLRDALEHTWPLFGLRILTPRSELQYPDDIDLMRVCDAVEEHGVHAAGFVPMDAWTLGSPLEVRRCVAQWQWKCRCDWKPEAWRFELAVINRLSERRPKVLGFQSMFGHDFSQLGTVHTGSWLIKPTQGKGLGTEMRQAMLTFAFDHLGAKRCLSDYWHDNHASRRVSEKCGYRVKGEEWELRPTTKDGDRRPDRKVYVAVTPETWIRPEFPVEITGFGNRVRELFGLK
jgi:RimJ/RimL family protein N-acetyltransferase